MRVRVAGRAGAYRCKVTAARRSLRSGRLALVANPRVSVLLPAGRTVVLTPAA